MRLAELGRIAIADIETDGLLNTVKNFWVGKVYDRERRVYETYYTAGEMVEALNQYETVVFHNGIAFDKPALELLSGKKLTSYVLDTLLLGKLVYYDQDKSFKHSLDAYGERLGEPKGHHTDWTKYSKEMEEYCEQDVRVLDKIFTHLMRKASWLPKEALDLEQDVQRIITEQERYGWLFDVEKAQKLHIELVGELEEAEKTLKKVFKPLFLPNGKSKTPKKPFRRLNITTIGEHQPIKLVEFNPASGKHIHWWISHLYNFNKWKYTEKGTPKTDSETIKQLFSEYEWAKPLLHYLEVNKLLGQLAEGGKAWLKMVQEDGRLHGQADILGTVTGRFTHSNPNMAQIPSIRAYKGKETRSLFTVKRGYKLVGADASGLELRTLSHYLARHDGGKYGESVLDGDIHTENQRAAGLPTRDEAKTFIYAFLYGAGDSKIGSIIGGGAKEGAKLKHSFTKKVRGLAQLLEGVKKAARRGYLVGISGRRLYVRSPHSALNTLLQSAGAYYMKYFLVDVDKKIKHLDAHFVGNIHDEIQLEVREDNVDEVVKILEDAFIEVGKQIGMRIKMEGEVKIGDNWRDTH